MDVGTLGLSGQTTAAVPFVYVQSGSGIDTSVGAASLPTSSLQTQGASVSASSSNPSMITSTSASESASLQKSAASLNQNSQPQFGSIEFTVDQQSNKMVLKVVDQETKQVLLQIPSKEALILSETIGNGGSGSLIHESA